MAEDQLSSFSDLPALIAEQQRIITLLKDILPVIKEVAEAAKSIEFKIQDPGSVKEAVTNTKNAEKAINDLSIAVKEYNKIRTQLEITEARLALAQSEEAKALIGKRTALNAVNKETREAAQVTLRAENAYNSLVDSAKAATAAYKQNAVQLGLNNEITIKSQKSALLLNERLRAIDAGVGQYARNVGNYASGNVALAFSMRNLSSELPNLGISLRTFAQSLSNNITPFFQAIQDTIKANKALQAEGKPTISVLKQIGSQFFSLGTFISLAVVAGLKLVEYFEKHPSAAKAAEDANKKYAESIKAIADESIKSANQEEARLQILVATTRDSTISIQQRYAAADQLQKLYPEILGNLSREELLSNKVAAAIDGITQSIFTRAASESASKKFALTSEEVYNINEKLQEQQANVTKSQKDYDQVLALVNSRLAKVGFIRDGLRVKLGDAKDAVDKERQSYDLLSESLNVATSRQQFYLSDAIRLGKEAQKAMDGARVAPSGRTPAVIRKELEDVNKTIEVTNINTTKHNELLSQQKKLQEELNDALGKEKKKKAGKDTTSAELAEEDKLAKAREKLANDTIQIELEKNRAIIDDDQKSLNERLNALHNFQAEQIKQADNTEGSLVAQLQAQLSTINKIESKSVDDRSNGEKKLLLQRTAILVELQDAQANYYASLGKIASEGAAKETAILDAESKKQTAIILSQLNNIAENENSKREQDLINLSDQYQKGVLTTLRYNTQKLSINNKYNALISQNTLDYLKDELTAYGLLPDEIAKVQEAITNITNKGIEDRKRKREADDKTYGAALDKKKELEKKLAEEIYELGFTIIDARYQKEINRINELSKLKEAQYEKERASIESSSLTEKEKKEKLAVLDAKIATDKERTDKQLAQINRKRAIAQRVEILGNIVAATAIAEVQALSYLSNPLTAALYPTIAALIAGIGTAQAAIVLAQPLPAYQFGTDSAKEGLGIWGEVGTEMKVSKSGEIEFSPNKPTVGYFHAGDKVIPHDELMAGAAMPYLGVGSNTDVIRAIGSMESTISREIRKKKEPNIIIQNDSVAIIARNQKN